MTVKFINMQTLSLRPQNDNEKLLMNNLYALHVSGKKPYLSVTDKGDMLIEIKSESNATSEEDEKSEV